MTQLIYCSAAAQAEIRRTPSWRTWAILRKSSLGLVPVTDGKCPYCNRDIKVIRERPPLA